MSVFVHAQGIKTVHAGGGVKKWQNSVHVVVECPLISSKGIARKYIYLIDEAVMITIMIHISGWQNTNC